MYGKLLEKIKEYDKITVFRHQKPDGDAVFSALGLSTFLKENFPDKKIMLCGSELYSKVNKIQKVSDRFVEDSLAIVVDTSTAARVDDDRFRKAKYIIKIDHHPCNDDFGDLNYVKHETAACCEYLAEILLSDEFKEYKMSKKVCEYLYSGMVTDSLNFRTASTTAQTLRIASVLAEKGELQISDIVEFLMDDTIEEYQKITKMRTYLRIKERFGHITLTDKELEEIGFDPFEAKNHISEIGTILDLKIWIFAVKVGTKYDVSIRSKRGYVINRICEKYGGGGHANAAGIKQITLKQLNELKKELIELSTKNPKK